MEAVFGNAVVEDVGELIDLYRTVYGSSYTLPLGTDPVVMAREIASPETVWLVARSGSHGRLVASIVASVDAGDRLAKLQGLAVHPDHRGGGLGDRAVAELTEAVLAQDMPVDSVYGTARTTSTAPQRICLRNGFHALGVFPNLRRAKRHETMVLLVRYRDGVLDRRHPVEHIPPGLAGLVDAVHGSLGDRSRPVVRAQQAPAPRVEAAPAKVELVDAPQFVLRRFHEVIADPTRRFYPFHRPNLLLAQEQGDYEAYVHLSRTDGYCALVGVAPNALAVTDHLDELITTLGDFGASYLETLVPLDAYRELCLLLAHGFFPAAAYPAMRRDGALFRDYVVMTRTMQPLNFRGLAIDSAFRPFTEQYIRLWTDEYLDTREVFR